MNKKTFIGIIKLRWLFFYTVIGFILYLILFINIPSFDNETISMISSNMFLYFIIKCNFKII
jgi:hypothetical protein